MFDANLIQQLFAATSAGSFLFLEETQFKSLLDAGYVEVNYGQPNLDGKTFPTRLSSKGLENISILIPNTIQPKEDNMTTPVQEQFEIENDVPLVETTRKRVSGVSKYCLERLEVGQSFFVPNTEHRVNAVKTMLSAALAAQKRFAVKTENTRVARTGKVVPVLEYTRKFVVKAAEKNGVQGARVWRKA